MTSLGRIRVNFKFATQQPNLRRVCHASASRHSGACRTSEIW